MAILDADRDRSPTTAELKPLRQAPRPQRSAPRGPAPSRDHGSQDAFLPHQGFKTSAPPVSSGAPLVATYTHA